MTLYDFIKNSRDDEITVFDKDYDMETYFYKDTTSDEWDKAMVELSKLLNVVSYGESGVTVNLSELIERKLDKLDNLFNVCEIDEIMDGMDLILAGNVSERWMTDFVSALQ